MIIGSVGCLAIGGGIKILKRYKNIIKSKINLISFIIHLNLITSNL